MFGDDFGFVCPRVDRCGVNLSPLVLFGGVLPVVFPTALLRDFLEITAGLDRGDGLLLEVPLDTTVDACSLLRDLDFTGVSDFLDAFVGGDALW